MHRRQSWSRREFLINTGVTAASLCIPGVGRSVLGHADMPKQLVVNPYADIDWSTIGQYKAALHMHTLQSDGYQPVAEVVEAYRKAGFRIVSITDHDWNQPNARIAWKELPTEKSSPYPREPRPGNYPANPTWPWTDYGCVSPEELELVGVQGNELTFRHHINSYFSDYGVWYERTGSQAPYGGIVDAAGKEIWEDDQLLAIRDKGGLAIINHPGISDEYAWWERKPLEWYVARYRDHSWKYLVGVEVTNCEPEYRHYDEGLWDQLLARFMPQRPIWGFGTDDMHDLSDARQSYTVFLLDTLNSDAVRHAMITGRFLFCSSTQKVNYQAERGDLSVFPSVREIAVDKLRGTITLRADNCDEVRWIAAPESLQPVADYRTSDRPWPVGRVVHVGPTLPYRTTPGIGSYVRAELVRREGDHTHRTFVNPFGFSDS